jgi:hypothetical protein
MKIAIMQPYLFPYIGYFQLVRAVDRFVFYDDVNFIKKGWINRNAILVHNEKNRFTLNLIDSSQNKKINEIIVGNNGNKILKTISQTYSNAPFFKQVFPIIEECLKNSEGKLISSIAAKSVQQIAGYLEMQTIFEFSSDRYSQSQNLRKVDRLVSICQGNNSSKYYNMESGRSLYSKDVFLQYEIELVFLKPTMCNYKQFDKKYIPGLSIIDVLMFNSKVDIFEMLNKYEIE